MKKAIVFILATLFLFQCKQKKNRPEDIPLSPTDLAKVLIEVHTIEAIILEHNYNLPDSAQVAYQRKEKELFKKLKINYQQYRNTYSYYIRENPEGLDKIYAIVIDSLQKREMKMRIRLRTKIGADSLDKVAPTHRLLKRKRLEKQL